MTTVKLRHKLMITMINKEERTMSQTEKPHRAYEHFHYDGRKLLQGIPKSELPFRFWKHFSKHCLAGKYLCIFHSPDRQTQRPFWTILNSSKILDKLKTVDYRGQAQQSIMQSSPGACPDRRIFITALDPARLRKLGLSPTRFCDKLTQPEDRLKERYEDLGAMWECCCLQITYTGKCGKAVLLRKGALTKPGFSQSILWMGAAGHAWS